MTRIDFHTNVPDKIAYACRLVRKARAGQNRLVVLTRDSEQLAALDQALWTFSETDFLPHVSVRIDYADPLASMTPIILADSDQVELPHHQILVNLSDATPAHFARFERVLEIIESDAADTQAGRERYGFYKQRGYPLKHFVADPHE